MTTPRTEAALVRCAGCGAVNRVPVKRLKENPLCGKCRNLLDFPVSGVKATAETFDRELTTWPETVLAFFRAPDCPDCGLVESVLDDIAFLRAGLIKVLKIDLATEPSLALLYSVRTAPVLLVFRNRARIARLDGAPRDKRELMPWIEQHIMSAS